MDTTVLEGQEEVDGPVVEKTSSETLNKIQTMLDTTKVRSSSFNAYILLICTY